MGGTSSCRFFKSIDLFGKEPGLYYKGRPRKTSMMGRICTIIYVIIYIAFLIYKLYRMLKRKDVVFYDTYSSNGKLPSIQLSKDNCFGAFALSNVLSPLRDAFIDETFYYPEATYIRNEKVGDKIVTTTEEIELVRCKNEYFGE